jgi:asparaginyl-tRNA synthetase
MEYLRTIGHQRPRTNTFQAVFRVRSLIAYAIHKFFQERDFVYVHTPIITSSDAEGAGEMFRVTTMDPANIPLKDDGSVDYSKDFFGKPVNLTVSGQLNGETYAMAFRNIYTFGPTFRAENSNTTRHAAEFWMIEPEIAFADLQDDMALAEDMMKFIINYVLEHAPEEMKFFNQFIDKGLLERLNHVATSDFARVTYTEAVELLQKHNDKFDYKVSWGCDLQTEHERYLTEKIFKRPVFVTDYPKDIKAFYMKQNPDGKTVAAVDLLVPGIGEIIGGSERENDYNKLLTRMQELGMNTDEYGYYLDLRRYGSTRHAGFGLGFERCVMYLTGMGNIRDVLPFPRTVGTCEL